MPKTNLLLKTNLDGISADYIAGMSCLQLSAKYKISVWTLLSFTERVGIRRTNREANLVRYAKIARSLQFTDRQRAIVIGSLLGDSSLYFGRSKYVRPVLTMGHGACQAQYAEWKRTELRPISQARLCHSGAAVSFSTKRTEELSELYKLLYKSGRKTITGNYLIELRDPLSIAVLIADDGGVSGNGLRIAACCFTEGETRLLSARITELGYRCSSFSFRQKAKRYWMIYLWREAVRKIAPLYLSEIPESMHYKIPRWAR